MQEKENIYTIAVEIKSESYFGKGLFLFDLVFGVSYWFVMDTFKEFLHPLAQIPYMVFNVVIAFWLTRKSAKNPGKRHFESLLYRLRTIGQKPYHVKERSKQDDIIYQEIEQVQEEEQN